MSFAERVAKMQTAQPPEPEREAFVLYVGPLHDPRPDLEDDSGMWDVVLYEAMQADRRAGTEHSERSIYGLLHGLRCGGARLTVTEQRKLRLDYQALLGWWNENRLRREWLMPARAEIAAVFEAARRLGEG